MKLGYKIAIPTVLMIGLLFFVAAISPSESPIGTGIGEGVTLNPIYSVTLERDGEIIYEQDVTNVITNTGLNLVRSKVSLASTSVAAVTQMSLSNDSADPAATDTNISAGTDTDGMEGEFTTCGLARAAGAVSDGEEAGSDDPGNWSVSYKWTSTCDNIKVWKFGVFNGTKTWDGSEEDVMFSAGNFTANVSMETNDELTVNVTYIVS